MENAEVDSVIAVFADHNAAEAAVKKLTTAGFEMKGLSVVGKGYHTDEKVVGFYNAGDRIKFWGKRGAFWGGFSGLFLGGLFMTIPVVGHVVVLGYLATIAIAGIENAVVVGGLSALGAALYSIGIPKDSVIQYETAVKSDSFLVMAHGTAEEMARAKTILGTAKPHASMCMQARKWQRRLTECDQFRSCQNTKCPLTQINDNCWFPQQLNKCLIPDISKFSLAVIFEIYVDKRLSWRASCRNPRSGLRSLFLRPRCRRRAMPRRRRKKLRRGQLFNTLLATACSCSAEGRSATRGRA